MMDSMCHELFSKVEESNPESPLQHPPVADPIDHGMSPINEHEKVMRNRAQKRRGTAVSSLRLSQGCISSAGVDNPYEGKRRKLQNPRSRSQIPKLEVGNSSRVNILYSGYVSRNHNLKGRRTARLQRQENIYHSGIHENDSGFDICDEGKDHFQRGERNFHNYIHGAEGSHAFNVFAKDPKRRCGNRWGNQAGETSGCSRRQGNANDPQARRPMGYQRLQDLSTLSSAEVIMVLGNSHCGFLERVNSPMKPDIIILIMKVLAKACQHEMRQIKASILATVCHSNFLEEIRQYFYGMLTDTNEGQESRIEDFINNLLIFCESVMMVLPNTASEKFEDLFKVTDVVMKGMEDYQKRNLTSQKEIFFKLQKQLANMIEERNSSGKKMRSKNELLQCQPPPDDFRGKSVFPTKEDIFGDAPFVRPNIVDGTYEDVEHYLDVQFRLLREDFVAPLREGIKQFVHQADSNKYEKRHIENVRIYRRVIFGISKVINHELCVIVHFDPEKRLINTKWEYSKRFMFGSLLCFSKNNFQDILFGTVLERKIEDLRKGQVTVLLCNEKEGQTMDWEDPVVMAESETYFEPYQLVLRALQRMTEETFPMYRYIISVEKERKPPLYLEENPHATYEIDQRNVEVLNRNSWPGEEALQLDTSQYEAFRAALTEEFVIIQGPPGTGKTFLGLKVAAALLKNSSVWNTHRTPILVVCYTNHALDQFLEGLLPITENIVRVGGQSKSDKLANFNLKERSKHLCYNLEGGCKHFSLTNTTSALRRDLKCTLRTLMIRIETIQANIEELQKMKGVLKLKDLQEANIISDSHLKSFESPQAFTDLMIEWLREGFHEMNFEDGHGLGATDAHNAASASKAADATNAVNTADFQDEDRIGRRLEPLLYLGVGHSNLSYAINIQQLEREIINLETVRYKYTEKVRMTFDEQNFLFRLIQRIYHTKLVLRYWKTCLKKLHRLDPNHIRILDATHNLWQLSYENRWILYKKWVKDYEICLKNEMQGVVSEYQSVLKRYEEAKQALDLEVMQSSLVVGMTTTMAARMQLLLQNLKPKIVIVEEAAEVLESHIVVSLTKQCKHLILIGDHQQLRPSTSVYKLAVQFHLDVSLFERMVKNGIHHRRLGVQHRMHPDIARLIVPAIYPDLLNHPSVQKYPQVKGVTKSLFFVSHSAKEEEVQDIMSHQNSHEAEFILHLCRYLLQQGYQPNEITILASYKGQMFLMKQRQRNMVALKDVKITVVDNFQGEENKIILLSLVRSNDEAKIGFLKTENRVCVALSRAKEGLYIIGNMSNLAESSTIWPKVKQSLEEQGCFGTQLTLQCSAHPHQLTQVSTGIDFVKLVPEGGCLLPCNGFPECGHRCHSICHANNHKEYICHEKCERIPPECSFDHPCPKECYQPCEKCVTMVERTLPCGHVKKLPCHVDHLKYNCQELVKATMPHCEHLVDKPCFQDIDTFRCCFKCENRLPCGHSCKHYCHPLHDPDHLEYKCMKPCAKKNAGCSQNHLCAKLCHEECGPCKIAVIQKLPCGHEQKIKCFIQPADFRCRRKCEKTLSCGHKCPLKCSDECGGCLQMVSKKIPECGHQLKVMCSMEPDHSKCRKECKRKLKCGHDCVSSCGLPCPSECLVIITSPVRPVCGHAVEISCYLSADVTPTSDVLLGSCQAPCEKVLACGHKCSGSCGQCLQGRIHAPCREKCEWPLICGHECREICAGACPPCDSKCLYRCWHSKCPRKCGEPCVPCKNPCRWRCRHSRCSKLCYEMCDRDPCNEPCKKKLKCGHNCIGFCGDPCPPLCRICDKDKVTEVFFGTEDKEDARFVLLVDCNHTLESAGLEQWLAQEEKEASEVVSMRTCPKCNSNIMKTQRFKNLVKRAFQDVQEVMRKIFCPQNTIEKVARKLQMDIVQQGMVVKDDFSGQPFHNWGRILLKCESRLQSVTYNQRKNLNLSAVECLKVQVDILLYLGRILHEIYSKLVHENIRQRVTDHFNFISNVLESRMHMSIQETEDFNRECQRFLRMTQLAVVRCSGNFQLTIDKNDMKELYDDTEREIYSIEIYSSERDQRVKTKLDELSKASGCEPLSEAEQKKIVHGVNLEQAYWFKCPNEHYYAVRERGGAMQEDKCPECHEKIGDTDHSVLPTSQLALEMEDALEDCIESGLL